MNFRMAQPKDLKGISELATALTRKYVVPDFTEQAAQKLLRALSEEAISNFVQSGVFYHVAEEDDRIIGLIGIHSNRHVYHLFVDENYQRQGIARQLWEMMKRLCILSGNEEKITVNSSLYAKAVYEKLGFVTTAEPQGRNGIITIAMEYRIKPQPESS